jgi:hypothetical protein
LEDDVSKIIKANHRRWEIEESFRIMKSEFKENFEKESKNIKLERYLKAIYAICKSYFKEEVLDGFLFDLNAIIKSEKKKCKKKA